MHAARPDADEQALLAAYEAGDVTPEERARAERLLRELPEAEHTLGRLEALRAATQAWAETELPTSSRRRILDAVLAPPSRIRRVGLPAAAVLAAAAVVLVVVSRRAPAPVAPATAPAPLAVRTGLGEYQLVPLGDRGVAFVGEQAEVTLSPGGDRLQVRRGSVRLVVKRERSLAPFVVHTPVAFVTVLGTEFDVAVSDDATEVKVVRGEVEVRNDHGRRRLWAKETAVTRRGESPRLVERLQPVVIDGPAEIVEPPRRRRR